VDDEEGAVTRQPLISVSFGGGVNSTALLIGLLERGERPDAILFADTGGEKPATYEHVDVMREWCNRNGFPELTRVSYSTSRHGTLENECINNGTLPSKAFWFGGCSQKRKRYPMDKWIDQWPEAQARWSSGEKVVRLIGIHAGETRRGKIPDDAKFTYRFPLREWGWDQKQCEDAITRHGMSIPVKSACFFCPAMRKVEVIALSKEHPDLFARAVEMEQNAKECGGLEVVKGLGRHWTWEGLVAADNQQMKMFGDDQAPMCDTCVDW
jgi:hypothetical protein